MSDYCKEEPQGSELNNRGVGFSIVDSFLLLKPTDNDAGFVLFKGRAVVIQRILYFEYPLGRRTFRALLRGTMIQVLFFRIEVTSDCIAGSHLEAFSPLVAVVKVNVFSADPHAYAAVSQNLDGGFRTLVDRPVSGFRPSARGGEGSILSPLLSAWDVWG